MNCIQCKEYLLEYAEGTLSDTLQKEVQAHIDTCPACAEEAALFAEMIDILQDMPEVELPEGYHAELMQKIQKESKTVLPFPTAKKRNWKNIGLVAAAVLLVAAAGGVQGIQKLRTAQEAVVAETTQQARISEDITQENIENIESIENAENSKESAIFETPQTQEQNMTTQETATPKSLTQSSNDTTSVTNNERTASPKTTLQETTIQETTPQETTSKPQVVMVEESQMAAQPQTAQEAPESGGGAEMANAGISMMRAAQNESYQATLTVNDIEQSIQAVRKVMLDLGGIEQISTESSITMTIASDKTEEVFAQLQKLGTLQEPEITPTQQDTITLTILLQQE